MQLYQVQSKVIITLIHSWYVLTVYTIFFEYPMHARFVYCVFHIRIHAQGLVSCQHQHELIIKKLFDLLKCSKFTIFHQYMAINIGQYQQNVHFCHPKQEYKDTVGPV